MTDDFSALQCHIEDCQAPVGRLFFFPGDEAFPLCDYHAVDLLKLAVDESRPLDRSKELIVIEEYVPADGSQNN